MNLFRSKRTSISIENKYCIKKIHFVGIGGSGMCSIAIILKQQGFYITGSDIEKHSDTIKYLLKLGIKIFFNHCYDNISQVDVLVISSAIASNNPEIQAAKQLNIPIMLRSEILSKLIQHKYSIAISGTHGKTTTTAMLTNIYIEAGLDPTFINGGIIKSEEAQARLGYSYNCIVEADESDKSLLCLYPKVVIITNIDKDHMYTYNQNFDYLKKTFIQFVHNLPTHGYVVVCIDDFGIRNILSKLNRKVITYGFNKNADLCILSYFQDVEVSTFTVLIKNNSKQLKVTLNSAPGYHNALNAVAAISVAVAEGIPENSILKAMSNFQGIGRRFENLGYYPLINFNGRSGKIMLVDDYGHHPVELHLTIMAARSGWPDKRLIMIFQPHRFTRIYDLFNDFTSVLSHVDILLVLDIYSAGERPIVGINSQALCRAICKLGKIQPIFILNNDFLLKKLLQLLQDNDLILIQGAGTISQIVRVLLKS